MMLNIGLVVEDFETGDYNDIVDFLRHYGKY